MFTHRRTITYADASLNLSTYREVQGEQESRIQVAVPGGTSEKQIDLVIESSTIKGFYMCADKAMTVKTNSTSAPDQTFNLEANIPVHFLTGSGETCPITADVTKLYVSNAGEAGAGDGTITVDILSDPTP